MGLFFYDTSFKSFSSKYVYVEAATTMASPSHGLSPELGKVNFVSVKKSLQRVKLKS
jgi:hypothetical protein